jgi:predicted enzyme related to lactoylglutathione lyase
MPYSGKSGEFCWNRLMTPDVNGAKKFYCKLFGWEIHKTALGQVPIYVFKDGDKQIAGMIERPIGGDEKSYPTMWMSYIAVEDINLTVTKAMELGAQVILPPTSISTNGYVAVLLDPTGARIGLWQAPNQIY